MAFSCKMPLNTRVLNMNNRQFNVSVADLASDLGILGSIATWPIVYS
jgi:hypothetical protein